MVPSSQPVIRSSSASFVGQTSLFTGKRVAKTDGRIQALGTNDELSSNLGVAMEFCRLQPALASTVDQLIFVQRRLQELNGHLASGTGGDDDGASSLVKFDTDGSFTRQLEQWIDEMDARLPVLTSFILPVSLVRLECPPTRFPSRL